MAGYWPSSFLSFSGSRKFWYGLEISALLCYVSKSRLPDAFLCRSLRFFLQGLGVSDTFVEHLEISEFCLIKLILI